MVATAGADENSDKGLSLDEMEKSVIYEMLRKNQWNRKRTANQMGIHPSTLWRKLKRLNINTPKQDGRTKNP
jgi:transcriptional regulator with PAS, ATPase and Fis domain